MRIGGREREGGRKGEGVDAGRARERETERECACLTSATANCGEMEGESKRGKNKRMRGRKSAPIALHYCCWKEGGERKRAGGIEEKIMGLMPADKQRRCWG